MKSHIEPDAILEEVRGRTNVFSPPTYFDPPKASAAELLKYGFSLEPDPVAAPDRYASWTRLFSQKLKFVDADFALPPLPHARESGIQKRDGQTTAMPPQLSKTCSVTRVFIGNCTLFSMPWVIWYPPAPPSP